MRSLAFLLSATTAMTALPVPAHAGVPVRAGPLLTIERGRTVPDNEKLEQLYLRGQERFDREEYEAAATLWAEALDLIEESELTSATRAMVLLNALSAYMEAFRDSREVRHLHSAAELIERYMSSLGGREPSDAVIEARQRLLAALAKVEEETGSSVEPRPGDRPSGDDEPSSAPDETSGTTDNPSPPPRTDLQAPPVRARAGTGMLVSGAVVTVVGLAASAIWISGILNVQTARKMQEDAGKTADPEDDREADELGQRGNTLVAAGAVTSGVLVAAGITLITIGAIQRKKYAVAPAIGRGYQGLHFQMRF